MASYDYPNLLEKKDTISIQNQGSVSIAERKREGIKKDPGRRQNLVGQGVEPTNLEKRY